MMRKGKRAKIAVLMGGVSSERDVSLRSGKAIADGLRSAGYEVFDAVANHADISVLKGLHVDAVFIALHGGEDGRVQKMLEDAGIPYTGSGPDASSAAMDKGVSKCRFVEATVPTAPYIILESVPNPAVASAVFTRLGARVVVKPIAQGSSVGVSIVEPDGFESAVRAAIGFDGRAIVEPFIKGRELTVAILDEAALPIIELKPRRFFYDYTAKYTKGQTEYMVNPDLPDDVASSVSDAGLSAFQCLGCRDWGRVDIMLSERGDVFVLEVNTVPGCTETSLVPKAAKAAGVDFPSLCSRIIEMTLERAAVGKSA
jgi:D-alanine-D-alanine ligase